MANNGPEPGVKEALGNGSMLESSENAFFKRNEASKGWVVQKYGGTAVGKYPREVASIVKRDLARRSIAVVCSARSALVKSEGTTTRLLRAAERAEAQDARASTHIVEDIRQDHIKAAASHITTSSIRAEFGAQIDAVCDGLIDFLAACQVLQESTPKTRDTIVSKGESLSCLFMTAVLRDCGVDAKFVDLSESMMTQHGSDSLKTKAPEGVGQTLYDSIASSIRAKIDECWPHVPVITGYFGHVPGGLLATIGRGYTDLCAALVAVGLSASELQIWKEVDGIYSADPRKVPTARFLSAITPAEASELTFYGSEVIHPFTMDQVIRKRIPITIRNVKNPGGSGTKILPDPVPIQLDGVNGDSRPDRGFLFRPRSNHGADGHYVRPKRPTAVTIKRNIIVVNVHSNKRSLSHGFFADIFRTLNDHRLTVDLISTSEVHVSMALHSENPFVRDGGTGKRIVDKDLRGALEQLELLGDVDLIDDMAILSLVGKEMKNMIGVAGRMFSVLGESNVNIEMISQGASEINISCVIESRDADRAMSILHTNLFTFPDENI